MAEKKIFSVKGMTCSHCVATVEKALKAVSGVVDYQVSLDEARAVVAYEPEVTDVTKIEAALKETGYEIGEM